MVDDARCPPSTVTVVVRAQGPRLRARAPGGTLSIEFDALDRITRINVE